MALSSVPNIPADEFAEIIQRVPTIVFEVAAFDSAGRVLLVKRGYDPFKGHWHLPGGYLSFDESFPEAVSRILWTETGLEVAASHFVGLYDYHGLDPRGRQVAAAWKVSARSGTPVAREGEEVQWFAILPEPFLDYHWPIIQTCREVPG